MRQIQCKYVPKLIAPSNAFFFPEDEYRTADGKTCRIKPLACWKDEDGSCEDDLENFCQCHHECSFEVIRSIWFGRLGRVSDYWYLVEMIEI